MRILKSLSINIIVEKSDSEPGLRSLRNESR